MVKFTNQGTDCFVNSSINAILSLPSFKTFLIDSSSLGCLKAGRGGLFLELRRLSKYASSGLPASSAMVRQLVASMNQRMDFENGQHDAAEFIIALFNSLEDEFIPESRAQIKLSSMFNSSITSNLSCLSPNCTNPGPREHLDPAANSKKGPVISLGSHESTLPLCLKCFLSGEAIDCLCPSCKHPRSYKSASQWEVKPQSLIIALPRFLFNKRTKQTEKNMKPIKVPTLLEIGNCTYSLTASIEHQGTQATNGHYYTYIRDVRTGEYTLCNDSEESRGATDLKQAYVLVYREVKKKPPRPQQMEGGRESARGLEGEDQSSSAK